MVQCISCEFAKKSSIQANLVIPNLYSLEKNRKETKFICALLDLSHVLKAISITHNYSGSKYRQECNYLKVQKFIYCCSFQCCHILVIKSFNQAGAILKLILFQLDRMISLALQVIFCSLPITFKNWHELL